MATFDRQDEQRILGAWIFCRISQVELSMNVMLAMAADDSRKISSVLVELQSPKKKKQLNENYCLASVEKLSNWVVFFGHYYLEIIK